MRCGLTRRQFLRAGACACVAVATGALAGCVDQHPPRAEGEGDRIVATSPAVMDICDRLELDLVGIPKTTHDVPARYAGLEQVGTPMAPDVEVLASMRPDYVLSPSTLIEDLRPKYAACGVACIFLDLKSVAGMYDSIAYLGRKFDRVDRAAALDAEYRAFLDDFQASIEGLARPRVLVLMGVPGSYLVATENSYVGSVVAQAGGNNVYAGSDEEFLNANTEDMQARDPDIILRTAHALPDEVQAMFAEEFATNDIWKHFRAVQEGRVFDLSYDKFGMSATFNYPAAFEELKGFLYGQAGDSASWQTQEEITT